MKIINIKKALKTLKIGKILFQVARTSLRNKTVKE